MILIDRTENDPFFNIAAEEYMLKNFDEDVFMLWINRPSVIIGKHQVAVAEADILYTYSNNIPVIRRISGGGTVYHDEGNLNYSLITTGKEGKLVDYEKYAGTVIRTLKAHGIEAYLQNTSSLFVHGKKFSGNAEHVFRNRVLHHGTLLFNSNLDQLRKCIRPSHYGYRDKSVRSVNSRILNLESLFPAEFSIEDLKAALFEQIRMDFPGISNYAFNTFERDSITELVESKYMSDEWNFGYSPKYELSRKTELNNETIDVDLFSEKGLIKKIDFRIKGETVYPDLSSALRGIMHHPKTVLQLMNKVNFAGSDAMLTGMF